MLDLGPEGGENVAEETPEQVAEELRSYTGGYLRDPLSKSERAELSVARPKKKKRGSVTVPDLKAAG